MKSLEHESGCRLLDRLGKKVVLTQVRGSLSALGDGSRIAET
jgi:DNA-binding transcriptional LysR family regulator